MTTEKQIKKLAIEWVYSQETHARSTDPETAFTAGAQWALEQLDPLCADGAALIEKLQAENERLRDALQDLYDEQNDAPLERRRAEWENAMEKAKNALK